MTEFGIDFGTTNSCAVRLPAGRNDRFGDEEGRPLPSIVVIDKATGEERCGRDVWRQRLEINERGGYHIITSIKKQLNEIRNWYTPSKRWTVPQVVAVVLKQLSKRAESFHIRGGIGKATFGVPVGMSPLARRNLREAADIAGIKVSGLVKESTAVLMRYWEPVRHCRYVAVFDWGGGTLDISLIEIRGDSLFELHTAGMPIAGDSLDDRIARFLHAEIMKQRGIPRSFEEMPPQDRDQMLFRCEIAKCELSSASERLVGLEEYDGRPSQMLLTRQLCRPIIESAVRQAVDLLGKCVHGAGISFEELDQLIVVGGSSRLWLLPELLGNDERFTGKCVFARDPEWDVAHGAALLEARPGQFALNETLALELSDGSNFALVARGASPTVNSFDLSVSLVEDARQANILVNRLPSGDHGSAQGLLQMAVPAMGFDKEDILLNYRLTEDLTFHLRGHSSARGIKAAVEQETEELLFSYKLE